MFTAEEIERYGRQILVPGWGADGQERVRAARAEVRGVGAAAEAALLYLAGAGVGTLVAERFVDAAREINPGIGIAQAPDNENDDDDDADASQNAVEVRVGDVIIAGREDRFAVGAAVAVEGLKAILGLELKTRVEL